MPNENRIREWLGKNEPFFKLVTFVFSIFTFSFAVYNFTTADKHLANVGQVVEVKDSVKQENNIMRDSIKKDLTPPKIKSLKTDKETSKKNPNKNPNTFAQDTTNHKRVKYDSITWRIALLDDRINNFDFKNHAGHIIGAELFHQRALLYEKKHLFIQAINDYQSSLFYNSDKIGIYKRLFSVKWENGMRLSATADFFLYLWYYLSWWQWAIIIVLIIVLFVGKD